MKSNKTSRGQMKKKYTMKTINIHPDWYSRFKAICDSQNRTPGMQIKELIQIGEKQYGLNQIPDSRLEATETGQNEQYDEPKKPVKPKHNSRKANK